MARLERLWSVRSFKSTTVVNVSRMALAGIVPFAPLGSSVANSDTKGVRRWQS